MAGGKRGVAAQLHLSRGGEPAQVKVGGISVGGNRERSLTEVIFCCDRLHQVIVQPAFERHHRGRIPRQRTLSESIDLKEGQRGHWPCSVMSDGSSVSRSTCPSGST